MAPSEVTPVVALSDRAAEVVQPKVQLGFGRNFGFLVHDVSRLIKRRFDRQARQTGLPITRRQAAVVLYIDRNEGVSQSEVATWLDLEPIALVRMLDKLHEEGLVERRAHPTDRRVRTLWLTPALSRKRERGKSRGAPPCKYIFQHRAHYLCARVQTAGLGAAPSGAR